MFGTVERGKMITRFRLEYTLRNGCAIYEIYQVPNVQLDTARLNVNLYGNVLDLLVMRLERRVAKHIG